MTRQAEKAALGEASIAPRDVSSTTGTEACFRKYAEWTPLVDWNEVFAGNRGINKQGIYELYDAPIGIRLRLEEAMKSEPVVVADRPWERKAQLVATGYWQADGKYHVLYNSYVREGIDRRTTAWGGAQVHTCYAVSEDAYHWSKPALGLVDFEGSRQNNILPETLPGIVFIDPSAPAEERFRAMGQEGVNFDPDTGEDLTSEEAGRRYTAMDRSGPAYKGPRAEGRYWITGMTSPDGIHWKRFKERLAEMPSDGGNAAQYDPETGTYFAYLRAGGMNRRATGLSRTDSFWKWPWPELVFFPDPQDEPDVSFYCANYFPYPGRKDLHGMIVSVYHQVPDNLDNQVAFSRNRTHWYRPERRTVIPVGGPGSGEEGIVRTGLCGLAELPDGLWGVLYEGSNMLHNATGFLPQVPGQLCWARWLPNRFCGIESEHEGRFTIVPVKRKGNSLRLNYRCRLGGWIQAELIPHIPSRINPDVAPIPGYTFAESDRLGGDSLDRPVTWNGSCDLSKAGESFGVRIRMFQAKLFAFAC